MSKEESMPVVVEEEKPTPEVVEKETQVEIELEKPAPKLQSEAEKLAESIRADFERLYGGRLKILEDRVHAADRVNGKLQHELEQAKKQLPPPTPMVPTTDELDKLVQEGQWKEAVGILARREAEAMLTQQMQLRQQEEQVQMNQKILEQTKSSVIAKYPDLDPQVGNPDSPVSKAYVSIINQHPEYLSNVYGPRLAMVDMEDALHTQGVELTQFQSSVASRPMQPNQEIFRRERVASTSLPPSRGPVKTNTVTLTKDQVDFCKQNGIPPEMYAKTLRSIEQTGGVTL